MRALASTTMAVLFILAAGPPARAQTYDPNYPVCIQVVQGFGGTYIDCSFTSIAQCAATASGRGATCLINPFFAPTGRVRRYRTSEAADWGRRVQT